MLARHFERIAVHDLNLINKAFAHDVITMKHGSACFAVGPTFVGQ